MDLELLEWLETNTFPEESKYQDLEYAEKSYRIFTDHIRRSATTRVCAFATIHNEATLLLMDQLEEAGIAAMVGKVNMDRNSPDYLREASAKEAAEGDKGMASGGGREALRPCAADSDSPFYSKLQ